jgi:TolB-like protein
MAPIPRRENPVYEFGPFRLDAGQRFLARDGELIPLAPKAFDTLLALVARPGEVLAKEDLLKAIWPDTFVEEGNLAQNISLLRKVLGYDPSGQQYIQTVPKRGYRFVAPRSDPRLSGEPRLNGFVTAKKPDSSPSVAVLPFANLSDGDGQEYFSDGLAEEIINELGRTAGLKVTARTSAFAFRGKEQDIKKIAEALCVGAILEGSVRKSGSRIPVTARLINANDGYEIWSQCYDRQLKDVFAVQHEIASSIAASLRINLTHTLEAHKPDLRADEAFLPLPSVAVLPFLFLSEVEDRQALSLGFADAVITALAHLEDIVVAPTSAILKYAPGVEPAHVCRELGVRHTLQGNVQKAGAQWRVSIQLFDVAAQRITLSERYDFRMENEFEIQDEIGRRVVNALGSRATPDIPKSRDRYASNPAAYNEFMAGLREGYSVRHETLESAVQHLSAAIERDPEFALAHAWLSYVSMNIYYHFDTRPARVETAEWHYRRALEIDPALPEANLAKAFILWSPAKNFQHAEAIATLEQVLEARPNLEQAHNRMCSICMHIGRFEEARLAFEGAQRANPKNLQIPARYVAETHLWSGDFTRAEKAGEAWIRESPGEPSAHSFYPQPPLMTGDLDLAEIRLNAGLKLRPDDPLISSLQGILHARRGEAASAIDCAMRALGVPLANGHFHHVYYQVACIYAVLGELHQAMAWLERSADTGFPCWPFFQVDPSLENLRGEPGFQRLIEDLERKYTALKIRRL